MNRLEMLALLKKRGIQVSDSITDAELKAKIEEVFNAAPANQPAATATPAPAAAVPGASAPNADVTNRLAQIEAKYEAERKNRITGAIDNAINDRRIVAAQRDNWIRRALADETVLTDIAAMPQQLPPEGVSVGVEITSEAISDIANHAKKLTGAVKATFIRKHEKRFAEVWNEGTNTIDSTLKQDVLVDGSLRAFAKVMANLSAFATKFENVPLRGSAKVQVPFFDLQTAASTDFVAANGYVAGDTTTDNREVTINKRKYQAIRFTSEELRRQPYLMLKEVGLRHLPRHSQRHHERKLRRRGPDRPRVRVRF
jgi:hypothetical protein